MIILEGMRKKGNPLPEPCMSCTARLESLQILWQGSQLFKTQGKGTKVTIYESLHIVDTLHLLLEISLYSAK